MSTAPPPGTVCCLLCRGMVAYRNLDTSRFMAHMNYEHGAYFDMEFLLAACLMDEEERKAVRNVMELKHRAQQEKGREQEAARGRRTEASEGERRGEKRALTAPSPEARPPPAQPLALPVKEETVQEVRVLPEQWEGPKARPTFPCSSCDKTFLLHKYLQVHLKRCGQGSPSKPSSPPRPAAAPEFKCGQCAYSGARERDLKLHVMKKHVEAAPARPVSPAASTTAAAPSSPPGSLFSSLSSSWTKGTKAVKEEPGEPTLQELTVSGAVSTATEESGRQPAPAPPVEATTFVAIGTDSTPAAPAAAADQVDISKSKYFKANPQTVDSQVEGRLKEKFDVTDDKLPAAWKVKEIVHEFKSGRKETKRHYLTPDCKALKTGLAVLEYMRLSGKYTAKEIMDYAKYLAVPVNRLEKYMELYL